MTAFKTLFFYLGYLYRKSVSNIFEIKGPHPAAYWLHVAYMASKFLPNYAWQKYATFEELITVEACGNSVLYIDIGANIGCYCIRVANAFREWDKLSVMAYEPFPESFALLKKNIEGNGLAGKIDAVNVALSDHAGTAALYLNATDPGSNSLRANNHTPVPPVLVNLTRLDDMEEVWERR